MAKDNNKTIIAIVVIGILLVGAWQFGLLDRFMKGEEVENVGMMCYDSNKEPIDCMDGTDSTFAVVELPVGTTVAQNVNFIRFVFRATNDGDTTLTDVKITELTCDNAICQNSFPSVPTTGIDLVIGDCNYWNWDPDPLKTGYGSCTHSDTVDGLIDVQDGLPTGTYNIHMKVEGTKGTLTASGTTDIQFSNLQQGLTIDTVVSLG